MKFDLKTIGNTIYNTCCGKKARKGKRKMRYALRLRGRVISRHSTLKAAKAAQRKVRGSRFTKIRSKR